ncbi:unnamed protein product [Brugia timori]|uniref:Uncharacterized protein n=1 Tax=Brugia timori TaxID=42155 RepID=A0A3P7VVM9_9BILA|nr:unnamed protein product [Brugia timori]
MIQRNRSKIKYARENGLHNRYNETSMHDELRECTGTLITITSMNKQ